MDSAISDLPARFQVDLYKLKEFIESVEIPLCRCFPPLLGRVNLDGKEDQ